MPCLIWTLRPCQWGGCRAQPQASSQEPRGSKANRQSLPMLPHQQVPTSSLSQRYGPAIIPQELVAEDGLFQPKLTLAGKTSKLTPRPDQPEVGTRQLTLCSSSTSSLRPSPNLVLFEPPASGRHGVVTWGHDAKITKSGVIPMGGSPSPGTANDSKDRRQDLGPLSECKT